MQRYGYLANLVQIIRTFVDMLHAGLIGTPLGHSASADYFRQHHPDCRYRLYEMASLDLLRQQIENEQLDGFNVTLPYKRSVMALLDHVDPVAQRIGAVNCVTVHRSGNAVTLTGHNTDYPAFAETLRPLLKPWHCKALVLGTGGAAQAVAYALREMGIEVTLVSRHPDGKVTVVYEDIPSLLDSHLLLINATPVGMWPHVDDTPMPDLQGVGRQHLCYDLIYNPTQTRWLQDAEQQGAVTCNGMAMLHRQAELSYQLWRQGK